MMEPSATGSLNVTGGDVAMSYELPSAEVPVSPAQVWARLAVDCRTRAIRLMAQLAFNLVVAQTDLTTKEAVYAAPICSAESSA